MSFGRLVRAWLLILALVMPVAACRSAGYVQDDLFVAPERFELRAPDADTWELETNRRGPRRTLVGYQRKGGGARLEIQVERLERGLERMPLDLLAKIVFVRRMKIEGGVPDLEAAYRILLDEREAIAVVGTRLERPIRWNVSLILFRSQGYQTTLTLSTLPDHVQEGSSELERLLRHFRVMLPGHFDPYVLGDLPMGLQGPYPGKPGPKGKETQEKPIDRNEQLPF